MTVNNARTNIIPPLRPTSNESNEDSGGDYIDISSKTSQAATIETEQLIISRHKGITARY
jgi:hypothetical protein